MIEVRNLSFRYRGADADTLRDLCFSVKRGEIFGFLGPSGAGKSTTQKIMIGLLKQYRGIFTILGKPAADWNRELYEHIGVGFEQPNLYGKFSGRENLRYFASFYRRSCLDPFPLLERLGLDDAAEQRVQDYSKGMRTRLSFARALMHDPEILFLDEPTTGLDPASARLVMELIKELRERGKTIFLTTHNMSVAEELCDTLGFLVEGSLRRLGPPKELKIEYGERSLTLEYLSSGKLHTRSFPLDGIGRNGEFLSILRHAEDGDIRRMHTGEASLEDVFLEITGTRLV
jgi:fluoroquinolone transport system ATP-binding protein